MQLIYAAQNPGSKIDKEMQEVDMSVGDCRNADRTNPDVTNFRHNLELNELKKVSTPISLVPDVTKPLYNE